MRWTEQDLASIKAKEAKAPAGGPARTIAGAWIELPLPPSVNDYWRHPGFNLFDGKLVAELVRVAHSGGVAGVMAWAKRRVNGLHLISTEGRRFKRHVAWELRRLGAIRPLEGRLRCEVVLHCRNASSDIDNRIKPLFDALQGAKAFNNDNQIDECHFWRAPISKAGKCLIFFEEMLHGNGAGKSKAAARPKERRDPGGQGGVHEGHQGVGGGRGALRIPRQEP